MRIDSHSGLRGVVVRKDTGAPLRWVIWADTDTGEYERFRMDPEALAANGLDLARFKERGRIPAGLRFVPDPELMSRAAARPPAQSLLPPTAPPPPKPRRQGVPLLILPGLPPPECEEPMCHAPAVWGVLDGQEEEPAVAGDGKTYARASAVRRRVYCDKHYRYPTMTSRRGVTREITEVVQP
jgi:hypothetical protein